MSFHRFVEKTFAGIVLGVASAPTWILRMLVALGRKLRSGRRPLVSPRGNNRGDPDQGSQGAGVPARLKPPPPVLVAAAAKALPGPGDEAAA